MDKPISVGDLVMVVQWPCCGAALGDIFVVANFFTSPGFHSCNKCWREIPKDFAVGPGSPGTRCGAPPAWLKRIPPIEELDDVKHEEEITMTVRILQGDCRDVLKTLPDESVHCVVTIAAVLGPARLRGCRTDRA
jgi:hypothetical protein